MWLRKLEFLDEKWIKCNLHGALKDPYFTRTAIFNTLIQDSELSDVKFNSAVNTVGRESFLRNDGKYYCGAKVLNCSCCDGICGPNSACICESCQLVPATLELPDDFQNHQEKSNEFSLTSEACFESWMWGPIPDDNQLNTCIKKLLAEQRKICLQASENSLSSFSLKMILKIYERYFTALARSKSRKTSISNRESIHIEDKSLSYEVAEAKEINLTKTERVKHELAKIGTRTALNFFFATLKRAWKSGDTELCTELLGDSLEAIQLSLEPGGLFDTTGLSTLWMEAIEKSIKFLRQIVLNEISNENEGGQQIPRADRNISLNLLLELEMQKGTLAGSLEGVLLLLTIAESNLHNNDNRQLPISSNGIPLVKILQRFGEINKDSSIIPTTDHLSFSPTESFLRFLSLPEGSEIDGELIDPQQAAVIIMSHLDRLCRSHLPSKMWTSRIQNYRNQQIISLGYNGLSPEFNVFSSEAEDKWMYDYTRNSNYSAPTIDFGANINVDQIACADNVIYLLSMTGEVFEVKLQSDQMKAFKLEGFDGVVTKIYSNCEGRHFIALTQNQEVFAWGNGDNGRLGLGEECLSMTKPTKISLLSEKQVIGASCGTTYSAVFTSNGELYTFGQGLFGKLGHGNSDDKFIPTLVNALKSYKIVDVACGDTHTLCVTDQGKVFAFGDSDFGKLGVGVTNGSQVPILVDTLSNIKNVYAGSHFSMAISHDGMSLYSFGKGGRLGHENVMEDLYVPKKIEGLNGKKINKIAVGSAHCLLLMENGELYGFGKNDFSQICPPCITKELIIAKPILTTPPFLKISGISCGSTQSIIWSHSAMICIPPRIPFVVDLSEQSFRLLDQLLTCVCGNISTATTSSVQNDHPPNQEAECIAVASLNLMCLQFHAMICNNISPKRVGLTGNRLKSIKSRILQLSGGSSILKTIQEAAQSALQVGWSILLPTPSERAQTLTSLLPDPSQASAHRFMTDLLVGSIMAEGGLETALNQIINSESHDCEQLPLLDLLKQLLHNNSNLTQTRLNQLLIENLTKTSEELIIDDTSSSSIDLLHKFQRLVFSHICAASNISNDLSGAESLLESYIVLMSSLCVSTLSKAHEVIIQEKENVATILQCDISDSLLYELLLGLILIQKERPTFLASFKWMDHLLPLLTSLDSINRLLYDTEVKNSDHMGWPGIICRDYDNDRHTVLSETQLIRKSDFENGILDGCKWIIINGCVYDVKDFMCENADIQLIIDTNIGKDLTIELSALEHQKTLEEITNNNSTFIGKYETEMSTKLKNIDQSYEKLCYFESEKTLAWILGMRSNILQKAMPLQPAEINCKKMLNSIILRGGLQTNIANPFDEEKFEARSSGSTAGSTPTTDVVNLLGDPQPITQCSPLLFRIHSLIYGLGEGKTNDPNVAAWISLSERYCKENNLIWHLEYSTDHPIIDVERLLTAVLIRHQSLGTLVLAVIDRDLTGSIGKIPQPISEIIKIVHMMKWNLIKIRQQLNRSYKEVCTPILEKCRFLLYEVRPSISPEQSGLKKLFHHYKEPRFKTIVKQIIEESHLNSEDHELESAKIDDLLNASIQSTHNSMSKVAQFVSEHFESHRSNESLHKAGSFEAVNFELISSKTPSNENLLAVETSIEGESSPLTSNAEEIPPEVIRSSEEFVNNVILKLSERHNKNEDSKFKSCVNNQIVDFVMQENFDVETLRRAMFCQIQRYQTRKEGLRMFNELLSINNLLDAAKYNIYNGFLNSAYGEENQETNDHQYDHILENLNLVTAYQKADILIAHSHILEWTIKEFQKYVNQDPVIGKHKWTHGEKDQSNLGTSVFLKKVSRARFLLMIFGLLAKNYTANELSLLINSGLLGTSLGLLHQTGSNDLPANNKNDRELSVVYEENIKFKHNFTKDGMLTGPELVKLMKIGTRVARGTDWKWGEQDGNGEGRIISEVGDDGWVRVEWDTGATNSYRMGKEGQYDLRLADSSFKTISPDAESDKDRIELFESKIHQNDFHPTKLLKNACIKLLQMVSTSIGVHGDKMQNDAVKVFVTMFYAILSQKNHHSLNIGLDMWRSIAFLKSILRSHNISKHITSELWLKLYFEMLRTPTQNEKDVYKKVQCIKLLQATLVQWTDGEREKIDEIVYELFHLLGNICMNCPFDQSLTQLPVGIKTKVLASASHSGTIAEEIITLLRKLHLLPAWNESVNNFLAQKMCIAADMFVDMEREGNLYEEKLNVAGALNVIGGYDRRLRIGIDLIYDSVKCSIFRMTPTGTVILNVHNSNETKNVSFTKVEKVIESGIFSLSKLSLNEILLNSFAVLMYGMNSSKSIENLMTFDVSLLSNQQIQLAALRATQVLFRHQSLLKTILRQKSPGILKYSSDDSMSDDSKNQKSDESDDKKDSVNSQEPRHELLIQSMLSRAIQSSPLKACYTQSEMETAALSICQTLSAHFKNNIPASHVRFQNIKQATMVHGNAIYNETTQESLYNPTPVNLHVTTESSRANPATKLVIQIMEMGFTRKTVELALKQITNRVEILPTAEQVVQWIIDHPELIVDESDSKGALNKINSFNVSSGGGGVDSDNDSTCSENLNSSSQTQHQQNHTKYAKRDDFKNADQYAMYVRSHIVPGMMVRCCRDFEEIRAGDVGIVLKVEPDDLHDLNVRVDFKSHERPFWMCFVHIELLEAPSDDLKSLNINYGSHVKIKSSSNISRTQVVKNSIGIVTAINGLEVIVDFPQQKSWCGQLGDLELVHSATTENERYDIIDDWSQCLKSLTVSSNESLAKNLLERNSLFWQSTHSNGRPWIRLEMRENILIHSLSLRIEPNDCSHQPSTIIIKTGDNVSSLKDFNWVTIRPNDTHVVLLSDIRQYFNWIEIYIKQCRNNGIQCRIHDLYIIGKRKQTDLDAMLVNASFLANDNDINETTYASSYLEEKLAKTSSTASSSSSECSSRVYVWGLNDKEQLAGLKGSKVKIPMYSAILSALKPIHIAGGSKSLFIVSQDGKLYACGEGTNGRLGLGHNNNVSTPQQVPVLSQYIVKKVAVHSGGKHAMAITLDGKIFSWGEGEDGKLGHGNRLTLEKPKLIDTLKTKRVRDIACGSSHSAAITSQGELYTWGLGEYGRLGHGDNQTLLKPKLISKLIGQRVIQVACGSRDAQTLCLTEDGTVYSWGDGDFGKLGRGGSDGCSVPQIVERLNGLGIIQIECGAQFSLALTKTGEIWTWGKGDYFRLGHGTDQHVRKPTPIQSLRGKKIIHVAVGALHCLAVTDSGQVFGWGDNDHGQQGSGTTSVNKKPTLVVGLDGVFVNRVACGSSHSVAWSLPDNELEQDKKEAVPFAFPKDPLGGHSLGMYSIDDQTTSSPSIASKVKQPRKSLSEIVLSLESTTALQVALSHILNAIKTLQARSCVIAALTSHAQIKNHQSSFDADKMLKEAKSEDIIELDKQEVLAQTSQRDCVNSQIAQGGGESLADDCDVPGGAEIILNDPEYPNNPLPNTSSNSLYRSLTNSMSMSISSCNNAAQKASQRMSTSAMSVMACIINRQEEMITETNAAKSSLDDFLILFGETEARNLLELLKLSVSGRVSGSQSNAETIANTLIELGINLSSIGNMIIETCISELEDLTSRHCIEKTPKPVVQESSHPYVDDITLVGNVKIPGAEYLRIEFDPQCSTEKRNDPLIIMDGSGRVVATRSGREFSQWAQEIRISGDEMRWKFTSDNSVNGWGFRFLVHGIMPASYLQELGSDRKILSQPSIDLVMVLLDSKLAPQNPNVLLRLISALSQCAQKGTLSINQRIWCLKKIHYYLTTSKYSSHASDASLLEIIQPLVPMIIKQYEYEETHVRSGFHLMHSEYFQCMIALACDLNVDMILPPNDAHKWHWFKRYCAAVRVAKALIKRTTLPKSFCIEVRKKIEESSVAGGANGNAVNTSATDLNSSMTSSSSYYQSSSMHASIHMENEMTDSLEKMLHEDHSLFSQNHDSQLLQWFNRRPEDWAFSLGGGASTIFGWGHNHRGQLGGLDGSRIKIPTPCEALSMLRPVQIVGGEQTLYAVTHDGKVYATGYGAGGRLGIGGTDSVAVPTLIESLQHVFIKKVAVNSGGKHCLALSSDHEVFSWGEGEDGKLGHGNRDSYDRPKLIEALSGLGVADIACGSAHSAAITSEGHLLTWGKGRYGRLGHGDSEDQLKPKVVETLLGYRVIDVACGSGDAQTLCITDDDNVWSFGDGDYGKLGRGGSDGCKIPMKIESLAGLGVIKVECGSQFSVALTRSGSVYTWGKGDYHRLGHGNSEHIRRPKKVAALQGKKVISIATGSLHCIACTDQGECYSWGDNDEGQLGDGTVTAIQRPRLVNALQGKHIVQVVCGSAHTLAISTCPHSANTRTLPAPPMEYDLVREIDPEVLQNRLVLLHHFSELICPCLAMIPNEGDLSLGTLRDTLVYSIKEATLRKVIQCTMVRDKPHGPTIELNRIQVKRSRNRSGNGLAGIDGMKSVFGQMVQKLPLLTQESLFLPHRVWKVKFVGESVDDCGGGFSESIAEMCDELQNGSVGLLIQTPNGRGEAGANRDCFLLDPTLSSVLHMNMFRFLGVLIGIAIRTGSPLSLNCLAEPVWRQLAGESLRPSDLTEVDRDYVTGLLCIRDMEDDPKIFQTMELPFSTPSAKGHEVFLSTKYTHITSENRHEYVKLALNYRLHEFDEQIKAVRDGMSKVIPVPLLSLFSATELQEMVCGSPDIPLGLLKTVATYKGVDSTSPLVQWFWEVMEEFTNQERSLFLRFVWGRTRLPRNIADFRGRDFVLQVLDKYNPPDHFLPESYTCFFLLKMPRYSCKAVLMEKLKYAIHFCKSIDTDDYARVAMGDPTSHTASEDNSDIESIA